MCPATEVPALVGRYLDGALPAGGRTPRQVRVTQVGEMCQKSGGRWLPFSEGEVLRYLAELAWVPQAMLANRQLEWRELDEHTVEVTTRVGSARATVRLEFDTAGDIVGTWCDARPYLEGKTPVPRPWAGRFNDYAVIGPIRIPTRAEVRWELPDGPFTYWRGTITSIELGLS